MIRFRIPMTNNIIYTERVSSNKTEALFLAFTIIFFALFLWRVASDSLDGFAIAFLCFFFFFLFYCVNYRVLVIRITPESLNLTFGIFTWTVPVNNIEAVRIDDLPALMRMGGAGIHFMFIRKRYRASFNFLEYPRVVIALKKQRGPVKDISFSTRQPDDILRHIREAISLQNVT